MRSHVTDKCGMVSQQTCRFQYRKRYEITCDDAKSDAISSQDMVSIPQAV